MLLSLFFTILKEVRYIKIFNSLQDVYDCYGEENIIPITNLKQIIFYTSVFHIQPKWTEESTKNKGKLVCYFHKGETCKPYEEWMKQKPSK